MARQQFRPNGSIKQYEIKSDFSGGMNTKEEDSLLTNNVAREVTNFNILQGGLLNKRLGFHALDIADEVATTLGVGRNVVDGFNITNSWTFLSSDRNVISLVTSSGYIINYIEGDDDTITFSKFETNNIVFQKYGEQAFIIVREENPDDTTSFINNVYVWSGDVWAEIVIQDDIEVEFDVDSPPAFMGGTELAEYGSRDPSEPDAVRIRECVLLPNKSGGVWLDNENFSYTDYKEMFNFDDLIKDLLQLPEGIILEVEEFKLAVEIEFEMNKSVKTKTIDITILAAGKYFVGSLINQLKEKSNYEYKILTTNYGESTSASETAMFVIFGNEIVSIYDGRDFGSTPLWNTNESEDIGLDVPNSNGNTYSNRIGWYSDRTEYGEGSGYTDRAFGIFGARNYWNYENTAESYRVSEVGSAFDGPMEFTMNSKTSIGTLKAKYNLTSNNFDKTIPDAYSLTNLSYNLLTIASNDEIETFLTPDPDKVKFDLESEAPDLAGIILLNGYYPTIDVPGSYKASLDLPPGEDRDNWEIGFQALPLTTFTTINASVESIQQYLDNVIKPTFNSQSNKSGEFTFTPRTTAAYVLFAVARKTKDDDGNTIPVDSITSLDGILLVERNVIPVESKEKLNSVKIIENFYKTDKSIAWKNQMFLFGNSNTFYVSRVNDFGYFPMLYNFQVPSDSPIVSMTTFNNSLLITTATQQFVLAGNAPADFAITPLNDDIGAIAPKTVKNNLNEVFQLTLGGVYKTKAAFNFDNRYNVEKVDDFINGQIALDRDAVALVYSDQYFIHTPSDNAIWIYYNSYKAWVKYTSPIFDLQDMYRIDEKLTLIGKNGFNIFRYGDDWTDKNTQGSIYPIESTYTSKEFDFGLQNHDKKIKTLQVRLADVDTLTELFITIDIDHSNVVNPNKTEVSIVNGKVVYQTITESQVTNRPRGVFDADGVDYDEANFISDADQLHEVVVSGRGRNVQFRVQHIDNAAMNIKNFGVVLKLKKPKPIRTTATREPRLINT